MSYLKKLERNLPLEASKRLTNRQISKIRLQKITDQFTMLAFGLSNYYKRTDFAMFIIATKIK